ncbi:MAG TPA: PepSY-like domain-containing protein [Flavisolibacter sp.]|nr:PepSY-like domain-containing protein [Flavisolibacter sp.]
MSKLASLFVLLVLFSIPSFAQIRQIPIAVEDAFKKQYAKADSVDYEDNLINVRVHFLENGEKMIATYSNKGVWKETEKAWDYNKLTRDIQDGYQKSKYADWKVSETAIIYTPDGSEHYRIKVQKSDVQKKYLYFDKTGRLTRDTLTI